MRGGGGGAKIEKTGQTVGVLVAEGDGLLEGVHFDAHEHGAEDFLGIALQAQQSESNQNVNSLHFSPACVA
jgi:hypothetical protein